MEFILQTLTFILAIISCIALVKIHVNQQDDGNSVRLMKKILLGGVSVSLICAGISLMRGVGFITETLIFGIVGFVFGSLIIISNWIKFRVYRKCFYHIF